MSTPASPTPISVDYTSKDYYALREDLIARIQDRVPDWTGEDPADFGIALVETFAYLGDLINYYIDRNANESFLPTATQRSSVLNIAQSYGYTPAGYSRAFTTIELSNSYTSAITLPAGSVFYGDIVIEDTVEKVYFTTDADIQVPAKVGVVNGVETITAQEGLPIALVATNANEYGEQIGTSNGFPNMVFELGEVPVVDDSIDIYVQDGDVYSKWTKVRHLVDYGPNDQVFEVSSDENDVVAIYFGDGVSGLIPTRFSDIRATYVVGGGNRGNVDQESIDTIYHVPALSESELIALQSRITITNTDVAIGGSDPETLNQIRRAAPLILRANNRAVTLQDYADLSLGVSDIAKANATADVWNSVTVYIAPTRNAATVELAPFYDSENNTTIEYDTLKAGVEEYLENKILLGTTVTISPPSYVDASVTIRYTKLPQYTTAQIEKSIRARLLLDFGYSNMFFEETIYPQDVEFVIQQVPGVKTARVTLLHRTGVALSAATASGTAITYTSGTTSHGLSVGSTVTVTGFSPSGYNVTAVPVTAVTDSTHFSVASTQSAGSATGTGAFTAYSTLIGNPNEIFRFQDTYLTVSAL
jgi:hypothetical protein